MNTFTSVVGKIAIGALIALPTLAAEHGGGHGGGFGGFGRAPGAHQHLDTRFAHNQPYFDRGYAVRSVPGGRLPGEFRGRDGGRYHLWGGNWYRWYGDRWIVWGAPVGLFLPLLPFYYTTVWWDGVPYYYANDTYYLWNGAVNQYEVVAPPGGIDANGSTRPPASDQLFVYPKNGQSAQQQSTDRFECHQWAANQSGFDPTTGAAAARQPVAKRDEYYRAQVACLEGRGYSVK